MQSCLSRVSERLPRGLWLAVLAGLNSLIIAQDVGRSGPVLSGVGPTVGKPQPTASKPESKLWFHDGSWWGSLWSAGSQAFHIQRLNSTTHAWVDTGVEIDARPDSHSDALWDGTKLYVATHEFSHGPGGDPGDPQLFLRYSYAAGNYTLDPGFPVVIGDVATETMVIEKDSKGTLWAVWKQGLRVHYSYTLGSDELWSVPAPLPSCTTDFDTDDICSIIRFNTNRIGVMWSDKVRKAFLFAKHVDGDPGTTWAPAEVALNEWDDHINLASDSTGRIFAVIKNSAEYVKLLVRPVGAVGGWAQYVVSDRTVRLTRPVVVLNEVDRTVKVFATSGGAIVEKSSSMDTIDFAADPGRVVIRDLDAVVNNATVSKRSVSSSTGLLVLAANESTAGTYWFHEVPRVPPTGSGLVMDAILPGQAGVNNDFVARGATPNKQVAFYGGLKLGTTVLPFTTCPAGVSIGLGAPFQRLGVARASTAGVATLRLLVPATMAGKTLHVQAVESYSCRASNLISEQM